MKKAVVIFLLIGFVSVSLYIIITTDGDFYRNRLMAYAHFFGLFVIIALLLLFCIFLFIKNKQLKDKNSEIDSFNELMKVFIDSCDNLIYLKDENLKYVLVNKALEKLYKKEASEIIGSEDFGISDREFTQIIRKTDLEVLQKMTIIKTEVSWRNRVYKTTQFPVKLSNGHYGVGAYIEDITEIKQERLRIEYLSFHDSLTGLYNRMFLEEELKRLDTERNLPFSIIVGDMNGLKLMNDIFGHAAGDQLLKKFADVLRKVCRSDDIIARQGGDEFTILLPKTEKEEAKRIITRIQNEFSKARVKAIKGSISLGCYTKTDASDNISQILKIAENAMYYEKTLYRNVIKSATINTLVETLHKNNPREAQHSAAVSKLCENIGRAMNLPEVKIRRLKEAGYLHDIGKIVLSEDIISKSELSEQELKVMRQHPVAGYRILNSFDSTLDLAEIILAHHERWDGSGYPKGLKGEEIPLMARIIAVAESYDDMTSKYNKAAISSENAVNELKEMSGTKFDPKIVDIFIRTMENK